MTITKGGINPVEPANIIRICYAEIQNHLIVENMSTIMKGVLGMRIKKINRRR